MTAKYSLANLLEEASKIIQAVLEKSDASNVENELNFADRKIKNVLNSNEESLLEAEIEYQITLSETKPLKLENHKYIE